jgi:hypothetical protein
MKSPRHSLSPAGEVCSYLQIALGLLLEAYDYAHQLERNVWDFAVEIETLRATGLSNSDLRWLQCKGYVVHAAETNPPGQDGRTFRQTGSLTFTKRTCFVLSEAGTVFARQLLETRGNRNEPKKHATAHPVRQSVRPPVPKWDKERQELRLGDVIVKQFKVPAPNQELILASFEEEGWPPRIDDPLPPHPDQDAKRRLHDTIVTLNRHQRHPLIRFLGDGSGQGVRWELLTRECDAEGLSCSDPPVS